MATDLIYLMIAGAGISSILVESRLFSPIRKLLRLEGVLCFPCVSWWSGLFVGLYYGVSFRESLITAIGSYLISTIIMAIRLEHLDA